MSKSVEQLVDEIITEIKNDTSTMHFNSNEFEKKISTSLNKAFLQVAHNNKENLYKSFAREFSADFFDKDVLSMLQKELKNCVSTSFYLQVLTNPFSKYHIFYEHLNRFSNLLQKSLQRYPQPLKALTNFFMGILNFTLRATFIATAILLFFADFIITLGDLIEKKLIKFFTNNQYNFLISQNKFKNNYQAARDLLNTQRIRYKAVYPTKADEHDTLSDNEFRGVIIELESNNRFNQMLAEQRSNSFTPRGLSKLALIAKAFFNAITTPLPQGIINQFFSIFLVKPVQLLITPVFLATALIKDLLHYVAAVILMATVSAAVAIKMAALIILNTPLLTIDFTKASINHTFSFFKNLGSNFSSVRGNAGENTLLSSTERIQQGLGESISASPYSNPQPPVHSLSMFSSLYRRLVPGYRPSTHEVTTRDGNGITP